MDILELIKAGDGYIALAMAVWVIQLGISQLKDLNAQHNGFVEKVLTQQQANNQQLADLVESLCHANIK